VASSAAPLAESPKPEALFLDPAEGRFPPKG